MRESEEKAGVYLKDSFVVSASSSEYLHAEGDHHVNVYHDVFYCSELDFPA